MRTLPVASRSRLKAVAVARFADRIACVSTFASRTGMRNIDINDLLASYEKGIYTLGEVTTALICEAQTRAPSELASQLPTEYRDAIEQAVSDLPLTATADDIVVFKSSREHAEAWFEGAIRWRGFFKGEKSKTAG